MFQNSCLFSFKLVYIQCADVEDICVNFYRKVLSKYFIKQL